MRKIFALFLVLAIPACANVPAPETPRERLAAAEATYQAVLTTIGQMVDRGQIRPEHVVPIREAIIAARTALNTAHRFPDNLDSVVAAEAALRAAQAILRSIASAAGESA